MSVTVTTNNVPRPVVDAWELTQAERAEFDYLAWDAIEAGTDSASFFRYRGELHDLGEFLLINYPYFEQAAEDWHKDWQGIATDSFFSVTVVRYCEDTDYVVVGRVYS